MLCYTQVYMDWRQTQTGERTHCAKAGAQGGAVVLAFLAEAYPTDAAEGMFSGACPVKATYVIPKPFDPRVVPRVARRVAEAAMNDGIARCPIADLAAYERDLRARLPFQG